MNALVRPARGTARQSAQKPKTQQAYSWPAPTMGLVANGNLAVAQPGAAYVLENYFCTATGVIIRRGKQLYATLGNPGQEVRSIFSYSTGNVRKLFAASDSSIYDITTITSPDNWMLSDEDGNALETDAGDTFGEDSTTGLVVYENTNGKWVVIQFQASDGSTYLRGVNGTDAPFVYDGTAFYPSVPDGLWSLAYDAETVAFTAGSVLTGGTSGATATIEKVIEDGTEGALWLSGVSVDAFEDNETITDADGGSATANGTVASLAPGLSFPDGETVTPDKLSFAWVYKNRHFFIQKESLDSWYLPVGQIGGELTKFSLGGQFKLGGHLVMGATWSRDTGSGLNAMCAFFSSEGEVAIYQGANPGDATDWSIVGVFRIGRPLGAKSLMDAGGDLIVATDIGFPPLSRALDTDFAILGSAAVSESIVDLWNDEVGLRAGEDWNVAFWSTRQMVIIALPTINDQPARWLVANAKTKAWSIFSGWDATCVHVFGDSCYFGGPDGKVFEAYVTGLDDGASYTATCVPMFDQMGVPGYKTVSMMRAVFRGPQPVREKVTDQSDYRVKLPAPPAASPVTVSGTWDNAIWGEDVWGEAGQTKSIYQQWRAAFGAGEVHAPAIQITSGASVPVDAELIRIDATFTVGEVVV